LIPPRLAKATIDAPSANLCFCFIEFPLLIK
jgi:hypothetical protein